jgi:hypothetical protein
MVIAMAIVGCAPARGARSPEVDAQAIASADARLKGAWRLRSFVPETPLEPMLEALVRFQYEHLIVRFDGQRLVADSPGLHVDRAYRIHEASGDRFKLTSFDEQGVAYETECFFVGRDALEIRSMTSPWRGIATIARAGAAP